MAVTIFLSATNILQIAAQLQKNAEYASVLYLNLTNPQRNVEALPAHDMEELRAAIQVNTTVTKLVISASWAEVRDERVNQFFPSVIQELSHLRNLKILDVQLIQQINFDRIGPVLTHFLENCKHLELLSFSRVEMGDLASHLFRDWASVLAQRSTFKEFKLERCSFADSQRNTPIMDPFLQALATSPSLEVVSLIGSENSIGIFSEQAFLRLCQSASLLEVHCHGWELPRIIAPLTSLFREQQCCIRSLDIDFVKEKEDYLNLAELLELDTSIESLDFHGTVPLKEEEKLLIKVANALRCNRKLRCLVLSDHRMHSVKVMHAFLDMLTVNYSLQFLGLSYNRFDTEQDLSAKMDFYLKLNRFGRGRLLEDEESSREDWLCKLVEVREDLSCLCYFLSKQPMLCQT